MTRDLSLADLLAGLLVSADLDHAGIGRDVGCSVTESRALAPRGAHADEPDLTRGIGRE